MIKEHPSIIAFSVDNKYINYASALVKSIRDHEISAGVVCRSIGLTQKNKDRLIRVNPEVQFIDDDTKLSRKRTLMKQYHDRAELYWTYSGSVYDMKGLRNITRTMYSPQMAYSCHSRFLTITELLDTKIERLLCLDADTIVNKNFDVLWEETDYDLCVVPYGTEQTLFNNEGLLLIGNTPDSKIFFGEVKKRLFDDEAFFEWDADTDVLHEVYDEHPINIKKIDKAYKDKHHKPDSYMWSGDGPRKNTNKFRSMIDNGTD